MRTLGVTEAFESLPEVVVLLFALLTQLGDPWFLFLALSLIYWTTPHWPTLDARRSAAFLLALGFGAAMLTLGLKTLLAFPRPPGAATAPTPPWLPSSLQPVVGWIATADGFGFPSGHALGAAVVYGGLAHLGDIAHRTQRLYAAGALVAVVALSRLVLGVHYLADVVVGAALGIAFLWGAIRVTERNPTRAFAVAIALALGALVIALVTSHPDEVVTATAGVGGTVGGLAGWRVLERRRAMDVRVPAAVIVPSVVAIAALWITATETEVSLVAVAILDFGAAFFAVSLPALVGMTGRRGSSRSENAG